MKMIAAVAPPEAIEKFEEEFVSRARPFTVVPKVWGEGRSGIHAGTRIHPGGESLFFTVVADDLADETVDWLVRLRNEAGTGDATRIFVLPVERMI